MNAKDIKHGQHVRQIGNSHNSPILKSCPGNGREYVRVKMLKSFQDELTCAGYTKDRIAEMKKYPWLKDVKTGRVGWSFSEGYEVISKPI